MVEGIDTVIINIEKEITIKAIPSHSPSGKTLEGEPSLPTRLISFIVLGGVVGRGVWGAGVCPGPVGIGVTGVDPEGS